MKIFVCPKCQFPWADIYLLDGNRCKICGSECTELPPHKESEEVFDSRSQTLEEFLNDSNVAQSTLDARRRCNAEGHKPYRDSGQGGNDCINGCYCGWIRLNRPAHVSTTLNSWSDLD